MLGGEGGEALEIRDDCFGAGHIEFAGRVHEVELRSFGTVVTREIRPGQSALGRTAESNRRYVALMCSSSRRVG